MGQRRFVGVQHGRVVIAAEIRGIPTSHACCAGWSAERIGRVRRVEAHAFLHKLIQVRRYNHSVAIRAGKEGNQLVGHNQQYVG